MVWIPPGWSVEKVDRVPGILSELAARSLSSQAVPASQNILKNSSVEAGGAVRGQLATGRGSMIIRARYGR